MKLYGLDEMPASTRYFTKACQLYRDRLKKMAELNEEHNLANLDMHSELSFIEGRRSIFGVCPQSIFNESSQGQSQNLFKNESYSNYRSRSHNVTSRNNLQTTKIINDTQSAAGISKIAGNLFEKTK